MVRKILPNKNLNILSQPYCYIAIIIHGTSAVYSKMEKEIDMKVKKYIWIGLTLVWIAVIFSFSLQSRSASNELSGSLLKQILLWLFPSLLYEPEVLDVIHNIFRKLAHFTEYFILGIFGVMSVMNLNMKKRLLKSVAFCTFVAILDETIQLFSHGRGARVGDVLLDMSGAFCGCMLLILLYNAYTKRKCKKSIKKQ